MIRLRDISDYRSELMGTAMAFIMASHTIGRFAPYGNVGVEWFLILSGVGLFFSLSTNDNIKRFYEKRFFRIVPTYLLVAIPFFLIKFPFNIKDFLIRISGLNLYFFWERFFWFIPMILLCYLIAPFYYKFILRNKYSLLFPFALAIVIFFLSFHTPRTQILITRFPIFLLGMHLGKAVYEDNTLFENKPQLFSILIPALGMLCVVLINYLPHRIEIYRQVYFLCGIPSLLFILSIVKCLVKIWPIQWLLSLMGNISLELFLVHPCIVLPLCLSIPLPKIIDVLISYVIAIIVAYVLHVLMALIQKHTIHSKQS